MRMGVRRQNKDTKHREPSTRQAMSLCRNKKYTVMLLEETSSEMNPVPTLLWKESPEACKKSGNLREIVESKS